MDDVNKERGLLRRVLDATPSMIFVKDCDGRFILVNRALARAYGTTPEAIVGKTDADFNANAQEVADFLRADREVIASRVEKHIAEEPVTHADGETRWFSTVKVPLVNDDDTCSAVLGVATDITARRQAEAALRDADRHKDEFLAVLSHELRNPLAPIRNGLSVLQQAPPGSEPWKRAHEIIERQVTHLTRLVDDLLDVTRVARGKVHLQRERLEVGGIVARTLADHRSLFIESGVLLEGHISSQPMWIDGDKVRLAQVIGNLLQNALKFTPRGGRVEVTLDAEDHVCRLTIKDSGVGIAPAVLGRLFEPFVQADQTLDRTHGGLGLGLALVRGLVDMHGGSVSAASEGPGRGASFTVRLPLAAMEAVAATAKAESAHTDGGRTVLVIEDNEDCADSMRDVLELMGHRVSVAHRGKAGVAMAHELHPDVVFCDIGLPDINGYAVAHACREDPTLRDTVLVALTGYALPEDRKKADEAGFQLHLSKPVSPEKLEQALARTR